MWDVKKPTSLFEKSRGRGARWCGQPLRVVGLGRDGTRMGPESRSCPFPLGRPVSRKAGKQVKHKTRKILTVRQVMYTAISRVDISTYDAHGIN